MLFNFNTFILLLFFFQYNTKIIVLPFRHNIPKSNLENGILQQFTSKELYTEISVGNPPQCLNFNINTESFIFYLQPDICYDNSPSFYNHSKSKTFHLETSDFEDEDYNDELGDGAYASEIFSLYNSTDLNTNITNITFQFFYSSYLYFKKAKNVCGILGFGLKQRTADYSLDTFLNSLKAIDLINEYTWTYIYFEKNEDKILNFPKITNAYIIDNFDGLIILGNYSNENNLNENNKNNFLSVLAAEKDKNLKWSLIFHKIFFNNKENKEEISITKDIYADLSINYDYIVSTREYFEKLILPLFNYYLEKQICNINKAKKSAYIYEVIFCDKKLFTDKDIKKFPTIYFYHYDFNYTFELTNDELFQEINDNIFFLIVKNIGDFNKDIWRLGKIFLKKYHFSFNQDSKMINFYNNMNFNKKYKKGKNKNIKNKINSNYLWIIICIICLIIGFYIGNKIIIRNRKKRANELQDEYEYKIEKDKNDKKSNFIGEKNIEMGTKGLDI